MKTISPEKIIERIKQDNPWWMSPYTLPDIYSKWRPRPYLELLIPLVEQVSIRRSVVLMGPRRVGKTVMIHHIIGQLLGKGVLPSNICYLSVDHPIYNGLSL